MGILTSTFSINYNINERANYEGKIRECEQAASNLTSTISDLDGVKTGLAKDSPEVKALEAKVKRLQALETELEQQKTKYQKKKAKKTNKILTILLTEFMVNKNLH